MPGKRKVVVFLTRLFFSVLRVLNVTVQSIARNEWLIFVKNKFYLSIFFNFTQVSVLEKTNRLNFLALSLKKENVSCTFHIETTVLIFVLYILIIFEIIWLYFCQEVANFAPFNIKKLVLKTFLFFFVTYDTSQSIIFVLFTKLKTVWVFVWFSIFGVNL